METLHKTRFFSVKFLESESIIISTWLPETESMNEAEMYQEVEKVSELIRLKKPKYYLANDRDNKYTYKIDEQTWVAQTLKKACFEVKVKKFASILPEDFIAELSTEQTVEEANLKQNHFQYFDSEADAIAWFSA